jgi:hypothetical protein
MRKKITIGMSAIAAAGLAIVFPGSAHAASGPQPASGTVLITSQVVDSVRVADGNTIVVVTLSGNLTGTINGPFTETDREVVHPDGSGTLVGMGIQSGELGTCGTGSVPYVTEARVTGTAISGRFQFIDQASSTSAPMKFHGVETFTGDAAAGEATYSGSYLCT